MWDRDGLACALVNGLWSLSAHGAESSFRVALGRPKETQARLLAGILSRNASTSYGRAMGFGAIRSMSEYRECVPLTGYDDYTDFIARIRNGEAAVLTQEPVTRLVPSSGSSGARKLIPYTSSLHREFGSGILPWIGALFRNQPELRWGPAYWSISPAIPEGDEAGVVPVGFEDDAYYLSPSMRRLVRQVQAVPAGVRCIRDVESFRIVTLLFLLRARGLRLISVWHPSFLVLLCRAMVDQWDRLLQLSADGFSSSELPAEESVILATGAPKLTAELERLDPRRPEAIWPRLRHISCWADGQAAGARRELAACFPNVAIEPKGLIATEAFISLPFEGAHPLAVCSHLFEFIDKSGDILGAEQLTMGEEYSVVVTTGGGLYRYRMHDTVRVDGFVQQTPSIVFVGKDDNVSDLVGEKLSEGFVASVLERVFGSTASQPEFALLAPEQTDCGFRYALFLGSGSSPPRGIANAVDEALRANPHYDLARRLGQLEPLVSCAVDEDAHGIFLSHAARSGRLLGSVKATCLSSDTGWRARLVRGDRSA